MKKDFKSISLYQYYTLIMLNIVSNTVLFAPDTLFERRFSGAQLALLLAPLYGAVMMSSALWLYNKFPHLSLVRIYQQVYGQWIGFFLTLCTALLFTSAGMLSLRGYCEVIKRFALPDTNYYAILAAMAIVPLLSILRSMIAIVSVVQIVFVLSVPLIVMLLFKSFFTEMRWDYVLSMIPYTAVSPDLESLAAATFYYTGYTYLAMLNPRMEKRPRIRGILLVYLLGIPMSIFSYIIPIGVLGPDAVGAVRLTWFITADSLYLDLFVIERVLFLFLLLFIGISTMLASTQLWEAGEMLRELLPKFRGKMYMILGLFAALILIFGYLMQSPVRFYSFADRWLLWRFYIEPGSILLLWGVAKARRMI